ncbi:hypothetical protein Lal_00039518 [Lupinus albus]|nr:hypothetical protein Lal_00039518 [Lupinus albus]
MGKFIIYERVAMNVTRSPWFNNLIVATFEVGQGVKCPTPYEISTMCLKAEYNNMHEWIKALKCTWKDIVGMIIKGTVFTNSIDASDVDSRNTTYYFQLLNKLVDEMREDYVVQIITDYEQTLKATSQKLMEKRPHLYWCACSAHCLDICLEDIGKKKNVPKIIGGSKDGDNFHL